VDSGSGSEVQRSSAARAMFRAEPEPRHPTIAIGGYEPAPA
jgi:hypothetical protein